MLGLISSSPPSAYDDVEVITLSKMFQEQRVGVNLEEVTQIARNHKQVQTTAELNETGELNRMHNNIIKKRTVKKKEKENKYIP